MTRSSRAAPCSRSTALREARLNNPPDLVRIEPEVVSGYPDRILARGEAAAAELKKRTLTNLYNQRPACLAMAHERLAVAVAYGSPVDLTDEEILERLFALSRERAAAGRWARAGNRHDDKDAPHNGQWSFTVIRVHPPPACGFRVSGRLGSFSGSRIRQEIPAAELRSPVPRLPLDAAFPWHMRLMATHGVCPWWAGYILANPIRRLFQDPRAILAPYVRPGMTVLEPGPGMGFFTLEIARLVEAAGKVVAVDVQPRMIAGLKRRAERAGLRERIDARAVPPESMGLDELDASVDFVFVFAALHEMPAAAPFFAEAACAMKPGASLLLAEPAGHVSEGDFAGQVQAATDAGLAAISHPTLTKSRAVLMQKPAI